MVFVVLALSTYFPDFKLWFQNMSELVLSNALIVTANMFVIPLMHSNLICYGSDSTIQLLTLECRVLIFWKSMQSKMVTYDSDISIMQIK